MPAMLLMLGPTDGGWAIYLSNGAILARFRGPGARWRATRYLDRLTRRPRPTSR
jgi:hypothetical protein